MSLRWERHFLNLAAEHARMSKDPSTKVGAVIVGPDREVRSAGFNGFPRGIADTHERLIDRDLKLSLMVHAEMNAVLAATRVGIPLKGCSLYLVATDKSNVVWGGPPCVRCTVEIIQTGINRIVSFSPRRIPSKWHETLFEARLLLFEANIELIEI